MATIPAVQGEQVSIATGAPRIQSIASPELFTGSTQAGNIQQAGQAISVAGDAAQRFAANLQEKEDTAFTTEAEAQFLNTITDYKIESRKRLGLNVDGLADEADKFYTDTAKSVIDNAPNDRVKLALQTIIAKHQPGFHGYIGSHAAEQIEKATEAGLESQVKSLISAAAADPAEAATTRGRVIASVSALAKTKGWDKDTTDAAILAKTTDLHSSVINALLVNSPSKATAYFALNKDEIAGEQQTKIANHLKATVDANAAMEGAETIWSKLGPQTDGQPVQLDVMEREARTMYAGDAPKIKETIAEIRSRAQAFESSERDRAAANTNAVMEAYAKGASPAQLRAMPEYLALPGDKKASISDHIDNRQYASMMRANAADARQDAAEQRAERKRQKKNFAQYLEYTNPDRLARMTEAEIIALIPDIGEDKTGSLMSMKRSLNNKESNVTEAKIDTDDFNKIATSMGLRPFNSKNSEDDKAALGELRFRVENLIQSQQDQLKRKLTRQEKNDLMRAETARAVTVDRGWFRSDQQVPIVNMTPQQVDKVLLKPAERKAAADRLRVLNARFPNNPAYQATERNLRMIHLQSISSAADYIDGP